MATGTLIFRPSADVSLSHTVSSGSSGYLMIADTTADDNSTYLSLALESTSSTSVSSVFLLTAASDLPLYDYKITAVRLYSRAMGSTNNNTGTYTCYFAAGTSAGGSSSNAATTGTLTSGNYETLSAESSELLSTINDALELDRELPIFSVKITSSGTKGSGKNASDGYIRITQVYMELDYEDTVFAPPVEEEGTTYYSLTISSINASITPNNGTTRLAEGSNQTILIIPTNPLLSLATDNGVDITNLLIKTEYSNTYTITELRSGASYGFELNNNGYYESTNLGLDNSASVCRINFELDSECAVTISYINYAQALKDYGIFGNIDTALSTSYTADTNAFYRCNTSNDNTSAVRTLTYNIPAGSHYIDIKYRKNNQTNSNNDSLQWKISNFEVLGADASYTYNLTNITEKHNIIFVFGEVTYYTITSTGTDCKVFPDGQVIVMPGNSYTVNIVPNTITDIIGIADNGINMTTNLIKEKGMDSEGHTIASYSYELTNVLANHNLEIIGVPADSILYLKVNGEWIIIADAYYKENGKWIKKDLSFFNDFDLTYIKKGT